MICLIVKTKSRMSTDQENATALFHMVYLFRPERSPKADILYFTGLFLYPRIDRSGHIVFWPSVRTPVCPFVHFFVRKNFYIGHSF